VVREQVEVALELGGAGRGVLDVEARLVEELGESALTRASARRGQGGVLARESRGVVELGLLGRVVYSCVQNR
jgi:hypothetical protein